MENLSAREWESLVLYSYILRGVVCDSATGRSFPSDQGETAGAGQESEETHFDKSYLGFDDAGYGACDASIRGQGLRGLQGLRNLTARSCRKDIYKDPRRPSSAPMGRRLGRAVTAQERTFSCHRQRATGENLLQAECGRAFFSTCLTEPEGWTPKDAIELRRGLVGQVAEKIIMQSSTEGG